MSTKAYLCKPSKIYPHSNADNIELAEVLGYQVIVGKDTVTTNTLGVLFLPDAVLTDTAIELFGEQPYLNKNRVKALTLRGEKSEALFLPYDKLISLNPMDDMVHITNGYWNVVELGEVSYDMPEGHLWNSYKLPQKEVDRRNKQAKQNARRALPNFPMHMNTEQLRIHRREVEDSIADPKAQVSVSLKYHGTSQRTGLIVTPDNLSWWQRLVNFIKPIYSTESLKLTNGTRRVILTEGVDKDYHGLDFRAQVAERLRPYIMANEVWYYEVVGYEPNDYSAEDPSKVVRPIMPHPEGRPYAYGYAPGEFGIRVYRITVNGIDLTPTEMEEVYVARRIEKQYDWSLPFQAIPDVNNIAQIDKYFDVLSNPDNTVNQDFTQEGLCVRIDYEGRDTPKIYKHKTHNFLVEEGRA